MAAIGFADYLLGPEISTAVFYVLPVGLVSWYGSPRSGLAVAFVAAMVWVSADYFGPVIYSHPAILWWNGAVRLLLFVTIALLTAGYHGRLIYERTLATTDSLTGAANRRAFFERTETERLRSRRFRRPFSIAYLDLDRFKWVNDNLGHNEGDRLLKEVVRVAREHTRATDTVARLGGDEFAVLLAETGSEESYDVTEKLRNLLVDTMRQNRWPVTFSIGLITYTEAPDSVSRAVALADDLMYSVKRTTRNRLAHMVWPRDTVEQVVA